MLDVVVLISGTGSNLLALLREAKKPEANFRVVAALADRPAAGLEHAANYGIDTHLIEPKNFADRSAWAKAFGRVIKNHGIKGGTSGKGLIVSAGLMRILPAEFVREFAPRLINTHPSLLPSFPGADAVGQALAAGVKETGVTIHFIDEGVDTGAVIAQARVPIESTDTNTILHERIKKIEQQLLPQIVGQISAGKIALTGEL